MYTNNAKDRNPALGHWLKLFGALAILLTVLPVHAANLTEYRERVESARAISEQLLDYVAKAEQGDVNPEFEHRMLAQIRDKIPPTEKIEWPGNSVETANEWLDAKLEAFRNEPDTTKRAVILTEINERLSALAEKIRELENPSASMRSKDEDKQKLADILRREEYQKPEEAKESLIEKWWLAFWRWLATVLPKPNISPVDFGGLSSLARVLGIVLGIAVVGLIGFAIYKYSPFFGRKARATKKTKKDRVILGERIADDESAADLFDEAKRLAREGNLRGAIRKGYIAFLCDLSDRKVIGLARHKTNRDYLRDVRARKDLHENMAFLTQSFERHWYGFELTEKADWEEFSKRLEFQR